MARRRAIPTMTRVPTMAFAIPPSSRPGGGGNCVNREILRRGTPFFTTSMMIEKRGASVSSESAMPAFIWTTPITMDAFILTEFKN